VASNASVEQAFSSGDVIFTIQNYHQLDANLVTTALTPLRVKQVDRAAGSQILYDLGTF